jgi:hypothetical protein
MSVQGSWPIVPGGVHSILPVREWSKKIKTPSGTQISGGLRSGIAAVCSTKLVRGSEGSISSVPHSHLVPKRHFFVSPKVIKKPPPPQITSTTQATRMEYSLNNKNVSNTSNNNPEPPHQLTLFLRSLHHGPLKFEFDNAKLPTSSALTNDDESSNSCEEYRLQKQASWSSSTSGSCCCGDDSLLSQNRRRKQSSRWEATFTSPRITPKITKDEDASPCTPDFSSLLLKVPRRSPSPLRSATHDNGKIQWSCPVDLEPRKRSTTPSAPTRESALQVEAYLDQAFDILRSRSVSSSAL